MCLAKVYICLADDRSPGSGQAPQTNGGLLVMENVTQVDIDGEDLRLRSLFGEAWSVRGRIASIDFSEGKLIVHGRESLARVEA